MTTPVSSSRESETLNAALRSNGLGWLNAIRGAANGSQESAPMNEGRDLRTSTLAQRSVGEIREQYGIEDFSKQGLLDTPVEGDKTVGEQAAETFINDVRDDVKDGKLDKDSDEAKLVDLIDAQGAIDHGYDLYGYVELMESGGSTYRESQTDPTKLSGEDVKELVDEKELAKQLSELMQKEAIGKRYDKALSEAVDKLPEETRSDMLDKVKAALFEPGLDASNLDFENYVIDMKDKAEADGDEELGDKVQTEVDNYFQALQVLDPDRYVDRKQAFDQNMMTHQLDSYMENPDSVDEELAGLGLRDTVDIVQHGVNGALQIMDKGDKSYNAYQKFSNDIEKFKNTFKDAKPEDRNQMIKVLTLAGEISRKSGASEAERNRLTQNVINDNLKGLPESTSSSYKQFLDSAASTGTLSALTGTFSLVSGSLQLANGNWDDMSSEERMAAVRDLISGLSFSNDFARMGSNIVEQLGGENSKGERRVNATAWLGLLDENFPDLWKNASQSKVDAVSNEIKNNVNEASDTLARRDIPLTDLTAEGRRDFNQISDELGQQMTQSTGGSESDTARKVGRTFLRFMGGAGLDVTGGVMDLVTGVKRLKDADNDLERAGAGLQIGAGAATSGMAIANTVSMFAPKGANLAGTIGNVGTKVMNGVLMGTRVAGPVLAIAGAIFGIAGSLIAEAINHKKMQKLTDSQGEFFKNLESYGVTENGWGDKLEFARYGSYMYGGRDTPDDRSIFDYQSKEWHHFQDAEGQRGSSLPRLAPHLHKDGDPGTENLWEKYLTGTTSRSGPKGHSYQTDDARPWSDTDMDAGNQGLGTDELRKNSRMDAMMTLYGKDFFDAHKEEIGTIATAWDDWNEGDSIVSRDDLKDIIADASKSQSEHDAAQFLLDENGFYDGLDSMKHGGNGDAKISTNDLETWLKELGQDSVDAYRQVAAVSNYDAQFLKDNAAEFQTIAENWDDWNGKDDIVSRDDLEDFIDDDSKSAAEKDAMDLLHDNSGLFGMLDTFQKGGDEDGKISTTDLDDWLATIGEGSLDTYRQSSVVGDYDADFYQDNGKALASIIERWDDWNGKDDIVSRDDLNDIVGDEDRSRDEHDAAELLKEDDGLFAVLDTFKKNDGSDDKISTKDLNAWLETIGVERRA